MFTMFRKDVKHANLPSLGVLNVRVLKCETCWEGADDIVNTSNVFDDVIHRYETLHTYPSTSLEKKIIDYC